MPIRRDKRDRYVEVEVSAPAEPLWVRCEACGELIFRRKLQENQYICPRCGAYFFLSARERLSALGDAGTFQELPPPPIPEDPLEFVDQIPYKERLRRAREETGLDEAALAGTAQIGGISVVLVTMDFRLIGGSMGVGVGEILRAAMEHAAHKKRPFVLVVSSGGARVQEGILSLLQMAKVVAARELLAQAKVPYIALLTYPSTGGVLASIGSISDVTIAEEGALIGFAGPRVIEQTTGERLPSGFQTAKFALEHGMVDAVVPRAQLKDELARVLSVLAGEG